MKISGDGNKTKHLANSETSLIVGVSQSRFQTFWAGALLYNVVSLLLLAAPAVCRLLAPLKHPAKRYESRQILAPLPVVTVFSNVLLLHPVSCPSPWPRPPTSLSPPQHRLSSQWTNFVIGSETAAGERPRPTNATWECNMWSCVTPDQDSGPLRGAKVKPESITLREAERRGEEKQTWIWNIGVCFELCFLFFLLKHWIPLSPTQSAFSLNRHWTVLAWPHQARTHPSSSLIGWTVLPTCVVRSWQ